MRRSFRVWQAGPGWWRWECTLCHPPMTGGRHGGAAWRLIVTTSLRQHLRSRHYHHQWVRQHLGATTAATARTPPVT